MLDWQGSAYIALDCETMAGGYIIDGGFHNVSLNGGSGSVIWSKESIANMILLASTFLFYTNNLDLINRYYGGAQPAFTAFGGVKAAVWLLRSWWIVTFVTIHLYCACIVQRFAVFLMRITLQENDIGYCTSRVFIV